MGDRSPLHTGLNRCTRCSGECDCLRVRGEDLVCPDCGEELKLVGTLQVYQGAKPYSTVAYFQNDGQRHQVAREDVTDPARLRQPAERTQSV